jgi:tetratricopeptide (TPR) repeat protein
MTGIQALRSLIEQMKPEEIKVFKRLLYSLDQRGQNFEAKAVKLFEALQENKVQAANELQILLYGKPNKNAFMRLQLRLRERIIESLMLDVNIQREGAYSKRSQVLYAIRKSLIAAQILLGRSMVGIADGLLDYVIDQGTAYEHFEETMSAIRIRMSSQSYAKGGLKFAKLKQQYDLCLETMLVSNRSEQIYNKIGTVTNFKKWTETDNDTLRKDIVGLEQAINQNHSATAEYYLNFCKTHYYQSLNAYTIAGETLRRQIELIKNSKSIFQPSRLANAYLNLGLNSLYSHKFQEANQIVTKALVLVSPHFITGLYFQEILFYAAYYSEKYALALKIISEMLEKSKQSNLFFQKGKWSYFKACALFMLGNHPDCGKILIEINPIETDKEGWNTAIRILTIMNLIEKRKLDQTTENIESMRKHFESLKTSTVIRKREKNILKILKKMERLSFNFENTRKVMSKELAELDSSNSAFQWEILSPEMVVFSHWFEYKLNGSKHQIHLPIKQDPSHSLKIA